MSVVTSVPPSLRSNTQSHTKVNLVHAIEPLVSLVFPHVYHEG